jgi:hypothetical protein
MPEAYKLSKIVDKLHKIIALIIKIQINQCHNNNSSKHTRVHNFETTRASPQLVDILKGIYDDRPSIF